MKHPGTLELPVLGLLKERAMHGYELRKQLSTMLGPFWQVSWGSLYPTLRRLARQGAVEKVTEDEPRRRKRKTGTLAGRASRVRTGGGKGRRKTVYRITPTGDDVFASMLEEAGSTLDAEHFTLRLAFFRYLRPEARLMLLERRRAYLQDKLAQFKTNLRDYRERMDGYALTLQNHDMAATETDIAWIDDLITKERGLKASPDVTTNA